ncbi:2,4-dienoyl-CoA reductase-like NADH-dependent reductase (Old Yellow Enzyme family) [Kitasatospora sp. GP82]|nr:2,4-dienoyl-CoA reductase-like NADH-dependent reductase (Old Yellow Enzyme family) [Kitasatospora sp. GP82]
MTSTPDDSRAARLLDRPFTLGDLTLHNRIAMAPVTRQFSPGGVPGADVAAYYARRARGGAGLIITRLTGKVERDHFHHA